MKQADSFLLEAGDSSARFFSVGAECRSWRIGARDMLWPGDSSIWPAVAPLLFPVCGWSRNGQIKIDNTLYPMPVHGFAAQSLFEAEPMGRNAICFRLRAGPQTRSSYPFDFEFAVTYRLAPDALEVFLDVANVGAQIMPYACGLHPGFTWNHAAGAHRFVFAEDEPPHVPAIAPGGLFSARRRPVPMQGRKLDLEPSLFAAEALCFLETKSRLFAFEGPEGRLSIAASGFPHLVLWNRQDAPFLAIESWTGTGDPEGFDGDFCQRPSMIHLAPGARRTHGVTYRWEPLGRADASP